MFNSENKITVSFDKRSFPETSIFLIISEFTELMFAITIMIAKNIFFLNIL